MNQKALQNYAREAADVSTNHKLPNLQFAHNHFGQVTKLNAMEYYMLLIASMIWQYNADSLGFMPKLYQNILAFAYL